MISKSNPVEFRRMTRNFHGDAIDVAANSCISRYRAKRVMKITQTDN